MKDTHFFNETGLDESEINREPGAIGSARDVAELFDYVHDNEPALLDATGADGAEVRVGGVAVIPQGLLPTSGHDSRLTDMSLVVVLVGCLAALMSRRPFPC
jgi:hypothetical protein